MLALILTGLLPPAQVFAGFGSETVLLILGLLILTAALIRTGVVDLFTQTIFLRTGTDLTRLLVIVTLPVTGLSAFLSNTAATTFFLPVVIGLAARAKVDASRLLMPVAFAAILASSVTLIGTSTNIVISGLITRYGLTPIRMFELSAVGIPIAAAGLLYLLLLGRYLVPSRGSAGALTEQFGIRQYLSELVIPPDSSLIGKTLAEAGLGHALDLTVLQIIRDDGKRIAAINIRKMTPTFDRWATTTWSPPPRKIDHCRTLSRDGPRITLTRISPSTAGWPMRRLVHLAAFAATMVSARSSKNWRNWKC